MDGHVAKLSPPMRRLPLPELALFAMTVVWGFSFLSIKWALETCGPITLTAARTAVGLAFLLALRPRALAATPLEWKAGALGGGLLALGYFLETAGMVQCSPGKSGFIAQAYVVLVPFLQAAVFRRRPAWAEVGSLALATAGIGLMSIRPGVDTSLGEMLIAVSTVTWAVQIVVVGRVAERVDPIRIAAVQLLVMTVLSAGGLPFAGEPVPHVTPALLGHIAYLGIGANAMGFLIQAWAQRTISPTRTAVLYCGQPIFVWIFSVTLADEHFDTREFAGAALIMAAVVVAVLLPARNDSAAAGAGR
jgi:drug/metabolite transporter (DMT)-like permease